MKLYGVESKFRHRSDNGAYRSFVYLASDEDDAIRQFNLDPNHRVYQDVLRVYQITYENCDLLFQLFRNILKTEEKAFTLKDKGCNLGAWGMHEYELEVNNVGSEGRTVIFKPYHVHCKDGKLQLMVCTDGFVPNWLYD